MLDFTGQKAEALAILVANDVLWWKHSSHSDGRGIARPEKGRWAEEALQKLMREFGWSREQALEKIKEKAPTWAAMLM